MYSRFKGTITQTYKRIKDDPKYRTEDMPAIRPKDVDYWFKHSHLTLDPKYYYKHEFNSFVAPGPKHNFQMDLFYQQDEQKKPDAPHHALRRRRSAVWNSTAKTT